MVIKTIPKKNTGFRPLIKLQRKFPSSRIIGKLVDKTNQLINNHNKSINYNTIIDESIIKELEYIYKTPNIKLKNTLKEINPSRYTVDFEL